MTNAVPSSTPARPATFDAALMACVPFLKKEAYRLERRHQDREDLVNATLLKAFEDWQKYRPEGRMTAWLWYVIRNIQSAKIRVGAREIAVESDKLRDAVTTPAAQEGFMHLREVLEALPDSRRTVATRIMLGFNTVEIGKQDGVTKARIGQKLADIRKVAREAA